MKSSKVLFSSLIMQQGGMWAGAMARVSLEK
jgi:hypothetical protein